MKGKEVNLPESVEDLKVELYPKNAEQIWETYQKIKPQYDFYNDDFVKEAIERTHEIAFDQIDKDVEVAYL